MEAEQRRDKKQPPKQPKRVYQYDQTLLEQARLIFESTETFILNPRDVDARSLLSTDTVWVRDFSRYMSEFAYQKQLLKRK